MALRNKWFVGVLLATVAVISVASAQAETCGACNCEFNNVEVLNKLIDAKVDARINMTLANQPSKLNFHGTLDQVLRLVLDYISYIVLANITKFFHPLLT